MTTMQVNSTLIKAALLSAIRHEKTSVADKDIPPSTAEQRRWLGDLLIRSHHNWKDDTLQLIDQVWNDERKGVAPVSLSDLTPAGSLSSTDIYLYRGDMTNLQVDAVVNAANDGGLGCFVPQHKCLDNVLHRAAGPRLRLACDELMRHRGTPLAAGTVPIVTDAFHLPSKYVVHVTGPAVIERTVTDQDRELLASAYNLSLDAALSAGAQSVAFPCISTGLFGFPADQASKIAVQTVLKWIEQHPDQLKSVVFDVFTDEDWKLYQASLNQLFGACEDENDTSRMAVEEDPRTTALRVAKQWVEDADAVLICAGAGMSVKEGEMVYTNIFDFAKHYPWFPKWGYKTGYETMGLLGDRSVPDTVKWGFWAKHMDNMRWSFAPNEGYNTLRNMVKNKNHFVLTSNVDGCFERAGFDPERIYTPQGEWTYLQCTKPCRHDSVFEARPYLDNLLSNIDDNGMVPPELIPKCPRCGSMMFGNVRGGDWYLHHKYEDQNAALQAWMQRLVDSNAKVVVLEVGAGFNTPTVTRFPVEAFAQDLGERGRLIRVNPSDPEIPKSLKAVAFAEGWQVLGDIAESEKVSENDLKLAEARVREYLDESELLIPGKQEEAMRRYFRHFDWRLFLDQLTDQ